MSRGVARSPRPGTHVGGGVTREPATHPQSRAGQERALPSQAGTLRATSPPTPRTCRCAVSGRPRASAPAGPSALSELFWSLQPVPPAARTVRAPRAAPRRTRSAQRLQVPAVCTRSRSRTHHRHPCLRRLRPRVSAAAAVNTGWTGPPHADGSSLV